MPWGEIYRLIGAGPIWLKERQAFLDAIKSAEDRKLNNVAHHLRIMLELRDKVMFDKPKQEQQNGTE